MNARNGALVIAALAGIATLGWKFVATGETGLVAAPVSSEELMAWEGFSDFCRGLHHELWVAEVRGDESRVRDYIVAHALDDLCGKQSPARVSKE